MIEIIIAILISIESGGNASAVGDNGKAVGILQIHPIMVREVNRISGSHYIYKDRLNPERSKEMCRIFLNHQIKRWEKRYGSKPTAVQLACSWNSGSIFREASESYKKKVREKINEKI